MAVFVVTVIAGALLAGFYAGQQTPDSALALSQKNNNSGVITSPAVTAVVNPVQKKQNRLLAKQLEQTRWWLDDAVDSHYSIQLFMARTIDADSIEAFLRNAPETLDFTKIYIYETVINGHNCYSVVYNDFDVQSRAIQSLDNLPEYLKANGAYLRRVSALKKDGMRTE